MKEVQVKIPEYITIRQYQKLKDYDSLEPFQKMVRIITTLSDFTEEEIRKWPAKTIVEVANALSDVTVSKSEFHTIVEYKGQLYGFNPLSKSIFGEYIDLAGLLKDPTENLHQIAAVLYRPVVKHRFNSMSFAIKHGHKVVNNQIKDPLKWYTVEEYDSIKREERSEMMKDFPVQIILGAMGFISVTGTLSLNDTLYSNNKMTLSEKNKTMTNLLRNLSQATGAGGGLYINSRKVIFSKLPEISV